MVLVLVLVVVAMLALGTLSFAELMVNEHRAAQTASRQSQARAFAESGAELARQFLDRWPDELQTAGGLYRQSSSVFIANSWPTRIRLTIRGRFTILAPKIDDTADRRRPLRPAGRIVRINLATILNFDQSSGSTDGSDTTADNTYAHAMLMGLPGMTDDTADAILDWIDADDTPRDQGAESDFYGSLDHGYTPRDAAPVSIEELLLVRGVTPELLFGYDAVKLGYSSSDAVSAAISGVGTDGSMDHGWAAYLTLWSAESTLKSDGTPKINLNQPDLQTLYTAVERRARPVVGRVHRRLSAGRRHRRLRRKPRHDHVGQGQLNTISSPLDLIGATVSLSPAPPAEAARGQAIVLTNPFTTDTGGDEPVPARTVRQLHDGVGHGDPGADQHQPGLADRAACAFPA